MDINPANLYERSVFQDYFGLLCVRLLVISICIYHTLSRETLAKCRQGRHAQADHRINPIRDMTAYRGERIPESDWRKQKRCNKEGVRKTNKHYHNGII